MFCTLSILWQQGLGRSAPATGLLVLPFALASLASAANSYRFSNRSGRKTVHAGIGGMFAGQALSAAKVMPSLVHTAQWATVANLVFILAAWCCTFGLPRTLERTEETA